MTFGDFILKLRERLQDVRKADASLITSAADDGRRWTSAKLVEVANDTLLEGMRFIAVYSNSPVLKQLASDLQNVIVYTAFSIPTVSGILATIPFPADCIGIPALLGDLSKEYTYISPIDFVSYLSDTTKLSRADKLFTILYDTTSKSKFINLLNYTAGENISGIYILARTDYTSSDFADDFFVRGLDDLFLDIAERQCRDREHHWDRSKVLDGRIKEKLGLSGSGG
jgi:hypothetical protein